ncbi:tRNA pseudouridine(55) synthase TruB [Rhodoferax lacus]|uniref:tRNA pseudouridine synthase B n=1 Tax=Rhodoferax lacus TaxID=2184758 RepID=A0A3E1RGV0_9BURK|nr:tRNA pseudouridine(55) synthase TruB [Rhodoferax lacus]RFO98607.1 tRNA pseudouridine(55) synthase TruB [Rhodoferax lacus]
MESAGPSQGATAAPKGGKVSQQKAKVQRRPVHGVLLLDKPLGLSSNQALQKVKWLLRAEKAGHTGTLDPLATGVLPICFGAATKFSQVHLDADKAYATTLRLGQKTSTADAEGEVIEERPVQFTVEQLEEAVQRFTGPISQVPPMHSALKKDGKALYEYARAGIEIEREARHVTIYSIQIVAARLDAECPEVDLEVACSKGTYIRTLGEDIGEALGCGAHLSALRRIRTGGFGQAQCVTVAALEAMSDAERLACVQPPEALLAGHTVVTLDADNAARFLSGMRRRGAWGDADAVAVFAEQPRALLGSAHVKGGELIPTRLLSPPEVSESLQQQLMNV